MKNFNNRTSKALKLRNKKDKFRSRYLSLLFIMLFFVCAYPQPKTEGQKSVDSIASEKSVAKKESASKDVEIVYAPNDPNLHKYLDSLNLFRAYQAQLKFNPPQNVYRSSRAEHLLKVMDILENNANVRAVYFRTLPVKPVDDEFVFYDDEESFRKACPEEALLIDAYKQLTFAEPAESGLWGTPELSHASIAPSSSYYGGIDINHSALNPVYKKPEKVIRYAGDYSEVEKYRSAPIIRVLQYLDVIDTVNMNLGGGESHYTWYPKNGPLRPISREVYPDCTPYNTRKLIPHY